MKQLNYKAGVQIFENFINRHTLHGLRLCTCVSRSVQLKLIATYVGLHSHPIIACKEYKIGVTYFVYYLINQKMWKGRQICKKCSTFICSS